MGESGTFYDSITTQNFSPQTQLRFLVIRLSMEMFAHSNELRHFFFGS